MVGIWQLIKNVYKNVRDIPWKLTNSLEGKFKLPTHTSHGYNQLIWIKHFFWFMSFNNKNMSVK